MKTIVRDAESQAMIDLFATRLDAVMKEKDINAADLSRMSGVSKGMISMYLKAKHEPGQSNVYRMARALRVSPAWLMALNGEHASAVPSSVLENEICDTVSKLSDQSKQQVLNIAAAFAEADAAKKGRKSAG